jgi:hypothetical protein
VPILKVFSIHKLKLYIHFSEKLNFTKPSPRMINGEKGTLNPNIGKSHQTYFATKVTNFFGFRK